jgi:F0F1-type ATP synthase membrane subunit b/b'
VDTLAIPANCNEGAMVATQRDASEIRAEIEQARDQLATTVDQLADRLAPKRIVDDVKTTLKQKALTPQGKAVLGGAGLLLSVLMIRNLRRSHRNR